ncbi:MAG: hypothetical protein JWN17_755, partial [Frankiales bacterium]|nr:hypothetical protein [Frankiales bacterium]
MTRLDLLAAGLGDVTREGARRAAHDELRRQPYRDAQPPLLVRVLQRVVRAIGHLLDSVPGVPGGRGGVVLLLLLLEGTVAVVAVRLGPLQRGGRRGAGLDVGDRLTAAGH